MTAASAEHSKRRTRVACIAALAATWVVLVGMGIHAIYGYSTGAGPRGEAPATWPLDTTLARSPTTPTLVMFVHPDCPCSRASIAELKAITRTAPDARIVVAFASREANGALWDAVGEIRGVTRALDRGGVEATRFGAATSGHTVVYDATGVLRFAGGVTGSRGHVGDNVGRRDAIAALAGAGSGRDHDVFGCELRTP